MAESAVLFHSYSFAAPLSCNESHQENPIHALSQSVSFGRFMTENLEWGKWSSFSHKKYVDEAEKYSQPGSVAQKKAFFEAHYKKIADAKKAKTDPESVVVLLNTLETLTKDDEESDESDSNLSSQELVLEKDEEHEVPDSQELVLEKDEELEVVVFEQEVIVAEDLQVENDIEDGELLKKSCLVEVKEEEEEEERRSVTGNISVIRLSMEKSVPLETPEKAIKLVFCESSESHSSKKKTEKPVLQKFSFLSCFLGNAKTRDQNTTKKKKKAYLCLCFKPEMVGKNL